MRMEARQDREHAGDWHRGHNDQGQGAATLEPPDRVEPHVNMAFAYAVPVYFDPFRTER